MLSVSRFSILCVVLCPLLLVFFFLLVIAWSMNYGWWLHDTQNEGGNKHNTTQNGQSRHWQHYAHETQDEDKNKHNTTQNGQSRHWQHYAHETQDEGWSFFFFWSLHGLWITADDYTFGVLDIFLRNKHCIPHTWLYLRFCSLLIYVILVHTIIVICTRASVYSSRASGLNHGIWE
jgi:hypothetical protein